MKVIELFAGIGAFRKALINLEIEHEVIGISEIDKYAIKSYETMYGSTHNFGNISEIEELPYCDLLTYGFPCQDISLAGKQAGIERVQEVVFYTKYKDFYKFTKTKTSYLNI